MKVSRWRRGYLLALGAGGLAGACGTGIGPTGEAPLPTRMAIHPEDFLGPLPCLRAPGAVRSYQVTLFDVTEELPGHETPEPFALPTSSIVPCEVSVQFQFVAPGHRYVAHVSAFDIEADELQQPSPGFPAVVDTQGRHVAPRWTTTCHGTPEALADALQTSPGEGGAGGAGGAGTVPGLRGALARTNAQIPVRGCEPLRDAGESPTGLLISLDSALVGLRCGSGPGQIASFVVDHPELPQGVFSAACGDTIALAPLPPHLDLEVRVTAQAAAEPVPDPGRGGAGGAGGQGTSEQPQLWVTHCRGRTAPGALLPASCDPLAPL